VRLYSPKHASGLSIEGAQSPSGSALFEGDEIARADKRNVPGLGRTGGLRTWTAAGSGRHQEVVSSGLVSLHFAVRLKTGMERPRQISCHPRIVGR
jgi:hypothetical protein